MLEMQITISAADLAAAINNLAAALNGKNLCAVCNRNGADNQHIHNVGAVNMDMGGKAQAQTAPVNPAAPVSGVPLTAAPATTAAPAAGTAPAPVPTAAPQYTLDMIAAAGSALIDAGKMDQLMQLLAKFGVTSLTELAPESYGAVAIELRALGAGI